MGADFIFVTFPRFWMRDERREVLRRAINELNDKDWKEFLDDCYCEDDYSREELLSEIEQASEMDTRETSQIFNHNEKGQGYFSNITGGMSWGDEPTEPYAIFARAGYLVTVYNSAVQFATEDYACTKQKRSTTGETA